MSGRLENKIAIVTGAGRGIGRQIALRFAQEGADLVVPDIDLALAEETVALIQQLDRKAVALKADVSNRIDAERIRDEALAAFGRIDILVNNAGIIPRTTFLDLPDEEWDRCMAVNLRGTFVCSQVVAREMVRAETRGKIVNIASVTSMVARVDHVAYCASKGGVLMLTKAIALDLAPYGINVNAVGPGTIDPGGPRPTDLSRLEATLQRVPMKRMGTTQDVANVALFLASEESSYMTGSIVYVEGGTLIE